MGRMIPPTTDRESDMPETRTATDAIDAAAQWWATVIKNPKFDALGGERDSNMEFAQVLMTLGNRNAPPVDTERFRDALAARLRAAPEHVRRFVGVDYHPDEMLEGAAHDAGVADTSFTFPVKTSMWIDADRVQVRYGYGAPVVTIWPEPSHAR